jgi:ABC-type multidrug transport system permease subunit
LNSWLYAIQVLGIAFIVSLVWFQTPRRVDTLTEQTGALFFLTIFWSFTPLFNSLTTFPQERAIIVKERKSGSYRLSAYFTAKILAEAPVELAYPIVFIIFVYFMVHFDYSAGSFFFSLMTILLSCLCAQSFGLLISCTLLDFKQSITFASVSMLSLMLLSGFYVKLEKIPIWLRWLSYACFPKYTYSILAYIQFAPFTFPCGSDLQNSGQGQGSGITLPCPATGNEIMSQYNFDTLPLWANIFILVAITIGFRGLAYCALYKTTAP